MPRLEEQESKKLYYFYSEKTGRKLRRFSNDKVSLEEISEFEIPDFLLEVENGKERSSVGKTSEDKAN